MAQLASARGELTYTWDRPSGVAMAASVPRRFGYPPGVLAKVAEVGARLAANRAAVRLKQGIRADTGPSTRASCRAMFETIPAPPLADIPDDRADAVFGWLRVAGPNPWVLRRVSEHPQHLPAAFHTLPSEDGVYAAASEGRLYLADWTSLQGLAAGTGRYLTAPRALFVRDGTALKPIGMQLEKRPDAPIYRPADGVRWAMARAHAEIADLNLQESFFHLGRAHFLLEAFQLAAERQLAAAHPIHVLLAPHFEGTLAINGAARDKLVVPGGQLETLLDPALDASLQLTRAALETFRLDRALPPADIAFRGLDDPALEHPYRDDSLVIWAAIRQFTEAYLRVYYDDTSVSKDVELQAFLDEVRSPDGGRLSGMPAAVATVADLADVVGYVIWAASGQHACCNYTQYDFMGYLPGMPAAGYAPPPGPHDAPDLEAAWSALLPPRSVVPDTVDFFFQQSAVRDNRLGDYPDGTFTDPRVQGPLQAFRSALSAADATLKARDARRFLPYPYLQPSLLTASIHI